MYSYIGRQPIFDTGNKVFGYEILYRNGNCEKNESCIVDGDKASKNVISDVYYLFGFEKLTNLKPAFINFTEGLLLDKTALLVDPKNVVIEVLEDVKISNKLIENIKELKSNGYTIALDDYTGDSYFDPVLPYMDIVKVDFLITDKEKQEVIAKKLGHSVKLLAEKVENIDVFNWAKDIGYHLFQGYYFATPSIKKKKVDQISQVTFSSLLKELNKPGIDFKRCSDIIYTDTVLTYKLLKAVNTVEYHTRSPITNVKDALVRMGARNAKQWLLLVFSQTNNTTVSDELIRIAFLRGLFLEELFNNHIPKLEGEKGFLLGMFSLLSKILDQDIEDILKDIELDNEIKEALMKTNKSSIYYKLLKFVEHYETQDLNVKLSDLGVNLSENTVHELYANKLMIVDKVFDSHS